MHSSVVEDIAWRCDRTGSAEARAALHAALWRRGVALAEGCPLSRGADILAASEAIKHRVSDVLWECTLCRKRFRTEHFLDKHLARRHADVYGDGRKCLADLCGVLVPCMPVTRVPLPHVSTMLMRVEDGDEGAVEIGPVGVVSPCDDAVERRSRMHACADVVRSCLGVTNAERPSRETRKLQRRLESELCERALQVECTRREEAWATFGSPSVFYDEDSNAKFVRIAFGWILLAVLIAAAWGNYKFRKARLGQPDLVRSKWRRRKKVKAR